MAFLDTTDKKRPPYIHQEYPKHINFEDKTFKVAHNAAEEAKIIADFGHKLPEKSKEVISETQQPDKSAEKAKQTLIGIAERFGIEIDKRWGIDRINEAINAAMDAETSSGAVVEE